MTKTKKIKKRNRRRRRLLSFILLLGLGALSLYFLINSDNFNIRKITVLGNDKVEAEEIIRVSQIEEGENIFKVKTASAGEDIEKLVYIRSASVKRGLPNNIFINVLERQEEIIIKNISSYYGADGEGYILNEIDGSKTDLPVFTGLYNKLISPGDNIFDQLEEKAIEEFIQVADKLGILKLMDLVDMENNDNIIITLNNTIDVAFGSLDNVKYKLSLLNEILNDIENKDIKYKRIIMNKGQHPILVVDE